MANNLPTRLKVAWWCYRDAAEVHRHPRGMRRLAESYYTGQGVTQDHAQAVAWYQKAADMGDACAKATLGSIYMRGDPRAGLAEDAARGFELVREAIARGFRPALLKLATDYLKGEGVAKDAAHAVTLLRQVIDQGGEYAILAQAELAGCYYAGDGVVADTVQASLWCQRAADGGDSAAIQMQTLIRTCNLCGTTPARKHCERCRRVRYCDTTCQAAHWNRETDPHKGHCRRAAPEASQHEAGGASTSAQ